MTPERAREVIRRQSAFPYWGNYQKFMSEDEIAFVRDLFENDRSGNITFGAVVHRISRRDMFEAPPSFDERDAEIARERVRAWNERPGARVGDWVTLRDGSWRRFTHDWGDGLQTTIKNNVDTSFYLGKGYVSFSGSLDPTLPRADLVETSETKNGNFWFFHHDSVGAHRGVYFEAPCRVFAQKDAATK